MNWLVSCRGAKPGDTAVIPGGCDAIPAGGTKVLPPLLPEGLPHEPDHQTPDGRDRGCGCLLGCGTRAPTDNGPGTARVRGRLSERADLCPARGSLRRPADGAG